MEWKKFIVKCFLFLLPLVPLYALLWSCCKPFLTNSISFDAKVFEVDRLKLKQIDIMAIGSSVTLNDMNTKVMKDSLHKSYYNFASWGLQISDDYNLIVNNVDRYKPKYLIVTSTFADFLTDENSTLIKNFDLSDSPLILYYFKNYYNARSVIYRWRDLKTSSKTNDGFSSLKFDEGGGVNLEISKQNQDFTRIVQAKKVMEVFPDMYTNLNYLSLNKIAAFLQSKNIKFIYIQAPYASTAINSKTMLQAVNKHFDVCKTIVESHKGVYLNKEVVSNIADSSFADPLHLSYSGSIVFTKKVVKNLASLVK